MKNPWLGFKHSDYMVHPDDVQAFEDHNSRSQDKYKFLPFLAPEPWIGRLDAPIVILLANPGATLENLAGAREENKYREEFSIKNLNQDLDKFPHYFLNPLLASDPGGEWWSKRMRELIDATSLEAVSNSILSLETIPYHSVNFKSPRKEISTQNYTYKILDEAISRGAVVLAHRQIRHWEAKVPSLKGYKNLFQPNSVRSTYFSKGNYPKAFSRLLDAVE
jgi:hypothetical protein